MQPWRPSYAADAGQNRDAMPTSIANQPNPAMSARPPVTPRRAQRTAPAAVDSITPHLYRPDAARPVRAKQRRLLAATQVVPHQHAWPQLTFSAQGVIRVTTARETIIVPPLRVVWMPAGMQHSIDVVEDAELRTVYLRPACRPSDDACWSQCLVLEMGGLLQALLLSLDTDADAASPDPAGLGHHGRCGRHENLVEPLLRAELAQAPQVHLGVPLPDAERGDKRLRSLCQAVLRQPARVATLTEWAAEAGASERTAARLFRKELGVSWQRWRQQALVAHALPMLARGAPVAIVATACGYATDSAFIAMFRGAMGKSPKHFRSDRSG